MSEQMNLTPKERAEIRKRINEQFGTRPDADKEWDEFFKTPKIVLSVKPDIESGRADDGKPNGLGQA